MDSTRGKAKIAIIVPGGLGTGPNNIGVPVLQQIVDEMAREFDVTVFSLFKVNPDYRPDKFVIISLSRGGPLQKIFTCIREFSRIHRNNKFKIIHGFWASPSGVLAVLIGKLFGIRSIVSILGGDATALPEIGYGQLRAPFTRWIVFKSLDSASEVIVLTRYLVNNLRTMGFRRQSMHVIPWGVDTKRFKFSNRVTGSMVRFLHVANLTPVKDQRTLLRAFGIIANILPSVLTIIGEGASEPDVRKWINDEGLADRVNLIKPVPYDQIHHYYQEADCLLHTSLSEGQCEVVTEAMSSGLLVCGTAVGLLFDQQDCCVSVPVKDHQALANEVILLMNDPSRAMRIRLAARAWAESHSLDWTVGQIANLYLRATK